MLTAEIEAEAVCRNIVTAIATALSPSAMVGLPMLGAVLLPGAMLLPTAALSPTALLLPGCGLLLRALLRRIASRLSAETTLLCRLRWLRTLLYLCALWLWLRLLLPLLLYRPIQLLLGTLWLGSRWPLLGTLFVLGLHLRLLGLLSLLGPFLLALLSGWLCALPLLLGSALLPLGAGLLFRLASLASPVLLFALLVPLCVAGSDHPGKQYQYGRVDHSCEFHGQCLP